VIRFARAQVTPIGLDIGADEIRMLQFSIGEDGAPTGIQATQTAPLLDRSAAPELIKRMMRQGAFVGRHVVVALPREIVRVRNIRLPLTSADAMHTEVQAEAQRALELDPGTAQVRFICAGRVRQGDEMREEVLVIAARHGEVELFVERLLRVGLTVDSIDFEPCALYRGVYRMMPGATEDEVCAVAEIGASRSEVVIGRGEQLTFYKRIDLGAAALNDAVGRRLGISVEEARALRRRLFEEKRESAEAREASGDAVRQALLDATRAHVDELGRQILMCLRYHAVTFRGERPGKLFLAGDQVLRQQLAPLLPLPLEPVLIRATDDSVDTGKWSIAAGLALKGVASPAPLLAETAQT
jgi:type IV pilus assembly protein PilM